MFHLPHADPVELPLAVSPWPVVIIIICYLLFVLKLGRQFMANRPPFDLRNILKVYNILQILYNGLLFSFALYCLFAYKPYDISCLTVKPQDDPFKNKERFICYAYFINKVIDLLDTIFIVLRKSYRQVTVLHVVHHVLMAFGTYCGIRFSGHGGPFLVMGYLNTFVHTVMYTYYYLSSTIPGIKETNWKKYITILQMVQFVLIIVHIVWTHMQPNCEVHSASKAVILSVATLMFIMFSNFYVHTYILSKKKQK